MPARRALLRVPVRAARRLAILAQGLGAPAPRRRPDAAAVRATAERLGCLQLDPVSAVAPSPLLVLRARLGAVDPALLDQVAYEERALFEYWAHEASYVCAADGPLHRWAMVTWPRGDGPRERRATAWLEANHAFRTHVLARLEAEGPLPAGAIENRARLAHHSSGWTPQERSVGEMLDLLWRRGEIMVARREGGRRLWDLGHRVLGDDPGPVPPEADVVERAAVRSLRALGVAREPHIRAHFTRNRYPGLPGVLGALEARGEIVPVEPEGLTGAWWVHSADAELLRALASDGGGGGAWRGRTALLSPFDNLLCDRARTEQLFDFTHRLEIYVPRARRRWGYYVLPILHGDRLIGRMDLAVDRRDRVLRALAVHAEPRPPRAGRAIRRELERLARWQGAEGIAFDAEPPAVWRAGLLGS